MLKNFKLLSIFSFSFSFSLTKATLVFSNVAGLSIGHGGWSAQLRLIKKTAIDSQVLDGKANGSIAT